MDAEELQTIESYVSEWLVDDEGCGCPECTLARHCGALISEVKRINSTRRGVMKDD